MGPRRYCDALDAFFYLCIIVGPVVYKVCECGVRVHSVGVCLYTNRYCICIQIRGVKKSTILYMIKEPSIVTTVLYQKLNIYPSSM